MLALTMTVWLMIYFILDNSISTGVEPQILKRQKCLWFKVKSHISNSNEAYMCTSMCGIALLLIVLRNIL